MLEILTSTRQLKMAGRHMMPPFERVMDLPTLQMSQRWHRTMGHSDNVTASAVHRLQRHEIAIAETTMALTDSVYMTSY